LSSGGFEYSRGSCYSVDALAKVVFVESARTARRFDAGGTRGEIEGSTSVSDLDPPPAGTISKTNKMLAEARGQLHSDPYGDGWIFEVRVDGDRSLDGPLDADSYRRLIEG